MSLGRAVRTQARAASFRAFRRSRPGVFRANDGEMVIDLCGPKEIQLYRETAVRLPGSTATDTQLL
jgi:hypothetical protein